MAEGLPNSTVFSREQMELVKRISILSDIQRLLIAQKKEAKLYILKSRTFVQMVLFFQQETSVVSRKLFTMTCLKCKAP